MTPSAKKTLGFIKPATLGLSSRGSQTAGNNKSTKSTVAFRNSSTLTVFLKSITLPLLERMQIESNIAHSIAVVTSRCLMYIEILTEQYPSIHNLSVCLLTLLHRCLQWETQTSTRIEIEAHIYWELEKCVKHLEKTLTNLFEKTQNHFGIFKSQPYIAELNVVREEILEQLAAVASGVDTENKDTSLDMTVNQIQSFFPKIWWKNNFGCKTNRVVWKKFEDSFFKTYAPQHPTSMEAFRKELIGEFEISDRNSAPHVYVEQFDKLTSAHGGLYEAYQVISDPFRLVYSMGLVGDELNIVASQPAPVKGLLGLKVIQVCCGGQHAAVLAEPGEIYTWGRGGYGRLGHGSTEDFKVPKRVDSLAMPSHLCIQVACGFAYTAAITKSNDLFTWGAGENGRLGHNDTEDRLLPVEVTALKGSVQRVYAGSVHTCALTITGDLYSWGKYEYTGHSSSADILEPKLVSFFKGIPLESVSVGPGGYHTIVLTKAGKVCTWGHNRVGQLGFKNSSAIPKNSEGAFFQPLPKEIEGLEGLNVKQVVAGWGHTALVTNDGALYICGRNVQGQLGLGDPNGFEINERGHSFQPIFSKVDKLDGIPIAQISCGGEHSVVRTVGSSVYSFGAGHKGQLGHGRGRNGPEYYPTLVEELYKTKREILHVACGNNCTLVLAGKKLLPKLTDICLETIHSDKEALAQWTHMESSVDVSYLQSKATEIRKGLPNATEDDASKLDEETIYSDLIRILEEDKDKNSLLSNR